MRTPIAAESGLPWGETTLDWIPSYNIRTGEIIRPLLDWVVVGGESGPGARPCDIEHLRGIVQQCKAAGVATFVKQLGANISPIVVDGCSVKERLFLKDKKGGLMDEWPADLRVREFPRV